MEEKEKKEAIEETIKVLEEIKEQDNYAITVIVAGEHHTMSLSVAKDAIFEQLAKTYVELKRNLDIILEELPVLEEMEKHGLLEDFLEE